MITIDTSHGLVPKPALARLGGKLTPAIEDMRATAKRDDYTDERASINLPADKKLRKDIRAYATRKARNVDILLVCGIGGSNLGTIAVQEAALGRLHNQSPRRTPAIYYADTVDPANISDILSIADRALRDGKRVLVDIVTKSGTTTETVANAEVFLRLLRERRKSLPDHAVVTTDRGSALWDLAEELGIDRLEIPKNVGGRYSVFSAVGMFPLNALGLDTDELARGAEQMRDRCVQPFASNPAAQSAARLHHHLQRGRNIHDTFLFSTDLESIGKWYRQLMAESLGKQGKGMTPTVSIGSTDLHSMVQLYLGGPGDKFTTFVTVKRDTQDIAVPRLRMGFERLASAEGKTFSGLRDAIFRGTVKAYQKRQRPFTHIELPERDEASIGQFLQLKMMEIIYLGRLLGVNAFNQPNVEEYKEETRKILEKR